ncbi:MAG TPA: helix-turn-helix domain-containing protein [Planctomycetaceae bacterium]
MSAVAGLLSVSERHVWRLRDGGLMPAPLKLGSAVRWRRTDLDAWLAAGCPPCRTVSPRRAKTPSGRPH